MAPQAEPIIHLEGLGRTFRSGEVEVAAVVDVSLRVMPADYVSIVGPSGSGKSTLLHVLGLLDRHTSGAYRFEGRDVEAMTEGERTALRAQRIGFVFQAFHLLAHRTVLENVTLATIYNGTPRRERVERARTAIERVGLSHRIDFHPSRLSGGERQRVAIARAIATRPSLLLCDEPTGNLDTATSESILALFEELRADGLTMVVITHDQAVSRHADHIVRMRDGHVEGSDP